MDTNNLDPRQWARFPSLADELAIELEIDLHSYGAVQHCRYMQSPPRGKPRGGLNYIVSNEKFLD